MIHRRLLHPNIVACHGIYHDARHLVMLLELVEGEELKQFLSKQRKLHEQHAAPLLLQAIPIHQAPRPKP
jgi:serine/threonine protein kinase